MLTLIGSKEKFKAISRNGSATNTLLEISKKSTMKNPRASKSPNQPLMASIETEGGLKHDEDY